MGQQLIAVVDQEGNLIPFSQSICWKHMPFRTIRIPLPPTSRIINVSTLSMRHRPTKVWIGGVHIMQYNKRIDFVQLRNSSPFSFPQRGKGKHQERNFYKALSNSEAKNNMMYQQTGSAGATRNRSAGAVKHWLEIVQSMLRKLETSLIFEF